MRYFAIAFLAVSTASASSRCPLLDSSSATDLARYISCSEDSVIQDCLSATHSYAPKLDALIPCLRINGCEGTDSLLSLCESQDTELRRRQGFFNPNTDTASDATTAKATDKTTDKATAKASNTDTAAKTTAANTKAVTTQTTAADTKSAATETTATPTTAATTDTTLQTSATSPTHYTTFAPDPNALVCLATSMISTSFCGILTVDGARTTLPCIPTTTPSAYCAPGLLCQTQAAGNTTCMVKQNSLTTSGLIVAIVFGAALLSCFTFLIFFICRSKRARKHQERMLQAEMVRNMHASGQRDLESTNAYAIVGARGRRNPSGSEASLPLMTQQGPAGGVDPNYAGVREARTLHKQRPVGSRGVSPIGEGDDIGYRRQG